MNLADSTPLAQRRAREEFLFSVLCWPVLFALCGLGFLYVWWLLLIGSAGGLDLLLGLGGVLRECLGQALDAIAVIVTSLVAVVAWTRLGEQNVPAAPLKVVQALTVVILMLIAASAPPIIFVEIHDPAGGLPQLVLVQLLTWIAMIMSRLVNKDAQAEVLLARLERDIALSQRTAEDRGHVYIQSHGLGRQMRRTAWFWLLPQGVVLGVMTLSFIPYLPNTSSDMVLVLLIGVFSFLPMHAAWWMASDLTESSKAPLVGYWLLKGFGLVLVSIGGVTLFLAHAYLPLVALTTLLFVFLCWFRKPQSRSRRPLLQRAQADVTNVMLDRLYQRRELLRRSVGQGVARRLEFPPGISPGADPTFGRGWGSAKADKSREV